MEMVNVASVVLITLLRSLETSSSVQIPFDLKKRISPYDNIESEAAYKAHLTHE